MEFDPRPVAGPGAPRELRPGPDQGAATRAGTMSERLHLALSWNSAAAELRAGLAASPGPTDVPLLLGPYGPSRSGTSPER